MDPCCIGRRTSHSTEVNYGSYRRSPITPRQHPVVGYRRKACSRTPIGHCRGNSPRDTCRYDPFVGKCPSRDEKEVAVGCSERCLAVFRCFGTPYMTGGFASDPSLLAHLTVTSVARGWEVQVRSSPPKCISTCSHAPIFKQHCDKLYDSTRNVVSLLLRTSEAVYIIGL